MKVFERYVAQVIKDVPLLQRRQVRRDLMADLLEEFQEAREKDSEIESDTLMAAVIKERPKPSELATGYQRETTGLIEAEPYPIYIFTLKIAVLVSVVCIVFVLFALGNTAVTDVIGRVGMSLAVVFSLVTINFYVLGRLGWLPHQAVKDLFKKTAHVTQKNSRSYDDLKAVMASIFLLVLILCPDWIGFPILLVSPEPTFGVYPVLTSWFLGWPRTVMTVWLTLSLVATALKRVRPGIFPVKFIKISELTGIVVGGTIMLSGEVFGIPSSYETLWLPAAAKDALTRLMPILVVVLNAAVWSAILLKFLSIYQWAFREIRAQ